MKSFTNHLILKAVQFNNRACNLVCPTHPRTSVSRSHKQLVSIGSSLGALQILNYL